MLCNLYACTFKVQFYQSNNPLAYERAVRLANTLFVMRVHDLLSELFAKRVPQSISQVPEHCVGYPCIYHILMSVFSIHIS